MWPPARPCGPCTRMSGLIACLLAAGVAAPSTSLPDAQAAIEANLRTSEGKAYDEKLGSELFEKHSTELKQCKQSAAGKLESFWMLLKLGKSGSVDELLLHPATPMGICVRSALLRATFSPPPRADYWVGVYLKLQR